VNAGGVKIIFSDTQTHCRGAENYRRSGVTDAMRIPKDAYFAHQVMWDGWVDDIAPRTYLCGHWNYKEGEIIPRLYVVSNAPSVRLLINGKETGIEPRRMYNYLFEFRNVPYQQAASPRKAPTPTEAPPPTPSAQPESQQPCGSSRIRVLRDGGPTERMWCWWSLRWWMPKGSAARSMTDG
jgi:hypothetical protein